MKMRWMTAAAVGLLTACSSEPNDGDPTPDVPTTDVGHDTAGDTVADATPDAVEDAEADAVVDTSSDADATEDTGPPPPPPTRPRRRMDLDQLRDSIAHATGTSGWVARDGESRFTALRATLGVPDYIRRTSEDLTPSIVFQKFLSDAARDVCTSAVLAEADGTAERVLLRYVEPNDTLGTNEAGIRDNLSYLLLRFHGTPIPADDPQLDPWIELVDTVQAEAEEPGLAWRTVCVGLLLHPAFLSY